EGLTGQLTHDAAGGFMALCHGRTTEPARQIRSFAPAVPDGVAAAIMRALERDPDARHPSIEAFGVALAAATADALGVGWHERTDVPLPESGPIREAALGEGRTRPAPPAAAVPGPSPTARPAPPAAAPASSSPAAPSSSTTPWRRRGRVLALGVAAAVV